MRFTAEDAFDASECGEPIILGAADIQAILADHGVEWREWCNTGHGDECDAAELLTFLGY